MYSGNVALASVLGVVGGVWWRNDQLNEEVSAPHRAPRTCSDRAYQFRLLLPTRSELHEATRGADCSIPADVRPTDCLFRTLTIGGGGDAV